MTERNDLDCRRRAMQLVSQIANDPKTALRIVGHMRALLLFSSGETDSACVLPAPDKAS